MLLCDHHMLLSVIAPRPLYVKSNEEVFWLGLDDELLSCRLALPVYELYGLKGVVVDEKIEINKPYHDGTIAYHCENGDHNLDEHDWRMVVGFVDKFLMNK